MRSALEDMQLVGRAPTPDDDPYVLSTMVRTVTGIGSGSPPPSYRGMERRDLSAIERELRRRWYSGDYTRLVAGHVEDPEMIAAFAIGRPGTLTFLAVRAGYQGMGLGTELLWHLDICREQPAVVEFATWDLERPEPGTTFPIGIINSGRWPHLHLVPWMP